jgi:hypothetical protein
MDTTNTYTEPLVFSLNACSLPFMHYKEAYYCLPNRRVRKT